MPYCRQCGNKLEDNDLFCAKCGSSVERDSYASKISDYKKAETSKSISRPISRPDDTMIRFQETTADNQTNKKTTGLIIAVVALSTFLLLFIVGGVVFFVTHKDKSESFDESNESLYESTDVTSLHGESYVDTEYYSADDIVTSSEPVIVSSEGTTTVSIEQTSSETTEQTGDDSESSDLSAALNCYYDFPDWYEMDKVVVFGNQVCYARDFTVMGDGTNIPRVWLFVFDENGYVIDEYKWDICPDETTAAEIYSWYSDIDDIYYDKNVIAYANETVELDVILNVTGYNSYADISMQDVIFYLDGELWGNPPNCEVVYK